MNLLGKIIASLVLPLGIIYAESSTQTEENEGVVALIVFIVAFLFVFSTVLGKKKDARTKTGYKDNKVPMRFIPRLIMSLVLAFVAVIILAIVIT